MDGQGINHRKTSGSTSAYEGLNPQHQTIHSVIISQKSHLDDKSPIHFETFSQ